MKQHPESKIEELAEKFSHKLADKLEKKEISVKEMAVLIGKFFALLNTAEAIQEIIDFIENI